MLKTVFEQYLRQFYQSKRHNDKAGDCDYFRDYPEPDTKLRHIEKRLSFCTTWRSSPSVSRG